MAPTFVIELALAVVKSATLDVVKVLGLQLTQCNIFNRVYQSDINK
jgi:hypothetical protein